MITIQGIDDFPTVCAVLPMPLADGRMAMAFVHQPTPGTAEVAYSKAYLVTANGVATAVGRSEPLGKDIGCALILIGTTLRMIVTEPPPGGGGAQSLPRWYDFPIGVGYPAAGGGTVDATARAQIAAVRTHLRNTP